MNETVGRVTPCAPVWSVRSSGGQGIARPALVCAIFFTRSNAFQWRDQVKQTVLQLRQNVLAFSHFISKTNFPPGAVPPDPRQHPRGVSLPFLRLATSKGLKHKRSKTKAPSHTETRCCSRRRPGCCRSDRRTARGRRSRPNRRRVTHGRRSQVQSPADS